MLVEEKKKPNKVCRQILPPLLYAYYPVGVDDLMHELTNFCTELFYSFL